MAFFGGRDHPNFLIPSLTGLLSFMLSDEMTTGSVTTNDTDKRAYAARSHAWNIEQRRFKEAFPDVSSRIVTCPIPAIAFASLDFMDPYLPK